MSRSRPDGSRPRVTRSHSTIDHVLTHPAAKPVVFLACLLPLFLLAWNGFQDNLGADPIEKIQKETGTWALRFLAITLAVTPAMRLFGWRPLIKYRRMLGLFTFFYATVHLSNYIGLEMFFNVGDIVEDVVEHPYVTIGMASFLLLIPLAITSTTGWIKRLGARRWRRLHQLVYLVAVGGTVHYLWAVKKDTLRPFTYAVVFALLLSYRVWGRYARELRAKARRPSSDVAAA